MRRVALAAALALALGLPAAAAATSTDPVYDEHGRLVDIPFIPTEKATLTKARATAILLAFPKVAHWLERYPVKGRITDATYTGKPYDDWTVKVWSGKAGEIAMGRVSDSTALVTEAWTGPQVAWTMARGYKGAFGGK